MARIRPRQKVILNAIRQEAALKRKGRKFTKRFRSWTQTRMRSYWMPMTVNLRSDPSLMDGQYLSACMQKAATVRKHDLDLWRGFSQRCMEIAPSLTPQQLAYIFYGCGKSYYLNEALYDALIEQTHALLPYFHSHWLMCVMYAMYRVQKRDVKMMDSVLQACIDKMDVMRPTDVVKIANYYAKLDGDNKTLCKQLSENIVKKYDDLNAQQFRGTMNTLALSNLYSNEAKEYILTRFQRIFMTARPQHYREALRAAVAMRVLHPSVWHSLPKQVKAFYIRLSMRRIPQQHHRPSQFHWAVSNVLAKMDIAHRNTFHWGCFWIDIGETENKNDCWFVDGPSSFFLSSKRYTASVKLQHRVLSELGWNIRRVRWDDWNQIPNADEAKMEFLRTIRDNHPLPAILTDRL